MSKISTKEIKDLISLSYQKGNPQDIISKYGLKKDSGLSNKEAQVYTDTQGNPIITYRGSNNVKDWLISDAALALGLEKYDPRFMKSQKLVDTVERKYGKQVTTTGHSLGGSLAEYSNPHGKVITVDKGVGLSTLGKTISKKQTDIRGQNDIVSLGALTQPHANKIVNIPRTSHIISPIQSHDVGLITRIGSKIY